MYERVDQIDKRGYETCAWRDGAWSHCVCGRQCKKPCDGRDKEGTGADEFRYV